MIRMRDIISLADEIGRRFQPRQIFLFGSYAYGCPGNDSDVDLLILIDGKHVHDRAITIRQTIDFDFPVDLLVRSSAEFEERIAEGDFFLREIQDKGKVLYEAPYARMGGKGGRRLRHRAARAPRKEIAQLR